MEPAPRPVRVEELLAHTGWMRGLARRLVRDAFTADDLVQETLVAAMERPPDGERPLRPWLGRVLRNLSSKVRRGDGRRAARERRGAAPEDAGDDPAALLVRVETHRRVVEEVARLEEPFRTAVLMRYFDGWSAARIARHLGIPAVTVRTRLHRGLAALRARLDAAEGGDRRAWVVLLGPLARRGPLPAWVRVAGIAAAAALLLWGGSEAVSWKARRTAAGGSDLAEAPIPSGPGRPVPPPPPAASRADAEDRGSEDGAAPAPADAADPAPLAPPAPVPEEEEDLAGIVIAGETGAPVPGARVRLLGLGFPGGTGPSPHAETVHNATADGEGRFLFPRPSRGYWELEATSPEEGRGSVVLRSPAGKRVTVAVRRPSPAALEGVVRLADGRPAFPVAVGARSTAETFANWDRHQVVTGPDGSFRIEGLSAGSWLLRASNGGLTEERRSGRPQANILPATAGPFEGGATGIEIVVEEGLILAGRVVGDTGAGIAGAVLSIFGEGVDPMGSSHHAVSGPDGAWSVGGMKPGTFMILAAPPEGRPATDVVLRGVEGGSRDVRVVMGRGLTIDGTVVGEDGTPLRGGDLRAMPLDPARRGPPIVWSRARVDGEGRFRLEGLAPGRYAIQLLSVGAPAPSGPFESGDRAPAPLLRGGGVVDAGTTGVRLVLDEGARLEGRVVDEGDRPLAGALIVVADPDGEDAIHVESDGSGGFSVKGLEPGKSYELTAQVWGRGESPPARVAAGTTGIRIEVGLGLHASGRLVDGAGRSLGPTSFFLLPEGGDEMEMKWVEVAEDGSWIAGGLEDRIYRAAVTLWGAEGRHHTVEAGRVRPGDEGVVLEVR